ncbi:MAG: DMT family transporter [Gammaproteobacteria bacterium]|nr:DMT family transporter [Gammaproteobacteria bacterium]NIR84904.1 DMT family transporter [Gammaproteobacteria bacterium]NIR91753.1 DMT family transporter [Gammaproteobacteria bacterium]NIU05951.1 DMT family transporter [Gammaproteobacteria bacterium]NIV52998.1 EamA family transporter [Gammaproteobacteria bacterium]
MAVPVVQRSLLGLHLGTLLLAGTALFPKLITLPAHQIIALRSLVALVALLIFARLQRVRLRLMERRDGWRIGLVGALMALHWVMIFFCIQMTTVAVGLICLFTFPVIVVFIEPFFSSERIRARDVLSGVAVVFGVYLVVPDMSLEDAYVLGIALGLVSALAYALRHVLYRHYLRAYPSTAMMFYQVAIAALVTLPFLRGGVDLGADLRWLYLLLLGVVFTALPHTLFANSLRHLKAKTVSLITSLQPVYGAVLAVIVLSEWPDARTVAGGVLIVAAAVRESLRGGEG